MEAFPPYHPPVVRDILAGRLFVRLDHQEARRRRLTKPSYGAKAKSEEFWTMETYFEKLVWRNYVEQHATLENGDVEGIVDEEVCDIVISLLKVRSGRPLE
ncbi:MAG: ribosylnicotinamide kinase [Ramalina farinacea]|uniref:Ribosylnicotinamide kinase n=1 Tax=Ramalina farinacea TaxID=258253 RepID=A0AA43QW32_9LECA|nr:ribosylnicotinamide kinase [Ramalina farinacea]